MNTETLEEVIRLFADLQGVDGIYREDDKVVIQVAGLEAKGLVEEHLEKLAESDEKSVDHFDNVVDIRL